MADSVKAKLSKAKHADKNKQNNHEDATASRQPSVASARPATPDAEHEKTVVKENEQVSTESSPSHLIHQQPTPRFPKDRQGGLPLTTAPKRSSYPMLQKWRKQVTDAASSLAYRAELAFRSASSKEDKTVKAEYSSSSSVDSKSGWDRVERREVGNGHYEQFVEQQDAREYDQIDAREAESGDDGEEEEDDLGGERWDKTL